MSQDHEEKRVYRDSEPALYDHLKSLSEAGFGEIVIDGQKYNVAKDKDEHWTYYFILVPVS
jgi:DNA-binding PadR family transcriptional regulator